MENRRTPLYDFHVAHGARMVPFAGWDMPIHYPAGIKAEHLACRNGAALFDVSHMTQIKLAGDGADAFLERHTPTDLNAIEDGRVRYSLFLNETGGVLDDLMIARFEGALHLVVNAGRAAHDIAHLEANLTGADTEMTVNNERALLALQGPAAAAVLDELGLNLNGFVFMDVKRFTFAGVECVITRSGYTGEDGFEISMAGSAAQTIANLLAAQADVFVCGLGARNTLRMEAGLPLWGHELNETINPVAAGLHFAISKRRREAGDFPGAAQILQDWDHGPARTLVGLLPIDRRPVRDGTDLILNGKPVGTVTSGGFAPSLDAPASIGFVDSCLTEPGTALIAARHGRESTVHVTTLPLIPHQYFRGS